MDAVDWPGDAVRPRSRIAAFACTLIGHRPDAPPIWNHGHGFARCTRCDRAIVRTIVLGWRLPPRGYRIRWPDREARVERPAPAAPVPTAAPTRTAPDDFMRDTRARPAANAFDFDDLGSDPPQRPERPRRRLSS